MRIHSNGYWFRSLVQVSIPKFWCWRLHISLTIWTTETSFAPFGSATIALGHSENWTRISPTVSEIFDRKNSPERDVSLFLLLAVRIHSYGFWVSNVVQVSIRKTWCWRLYISGTITTTETRFAPLVARLLPLDTVKTELEYLLPFQRYSTRKTTIWRDVSLLAVRIHSNGYWFRSLVQVSIPQFWCWRRHISETILTTETSFAPFGSGTIALGHSENRTRISPTISEIFDRKNSPERGYFFIMPCELIRRHIRVCSNKMENFLMLATAISQKR